MLSQFDHKIMGKIATETWWSRVIRIAIQKIFFRIVNPNQYTGPYVLMLITCNNLLEFIHHLNQFIMQVKKNFGLLLGALLSMIMGYAQSMAQPVDVGGAPMYPSKNIIENAVNSKDHTTLVAAVKA